MEFDWALAAQLVTAFVAATFGFIKAGSALFKFFGKK